MISIWLAFILANTALGDSAREDQLVNQHMQHTQTKLQIMRDKTVLENQKGAPPLERSPTYEDPAQYRSYGVEMPKAQPFEHLDLDHFDEEETPSAK